MTRPLVGTGEGMYATVAKLDEEHPFPWEADVDPVGGAVIVDAGGDTVITLGMGEHFKELAIRLASYINSYREEA